MASVWGELKRRNVVRVAVAYTIASWLIMQFANIMVPLLTLPEWVERLVFFILMVGFPLALFFAWAFELTPEGIKKEKDVDRSESVTQVTGRRLDFIIIGVLAIALVFFAVDKYVLVPAASPVSEAAPEADTADIQKSIAVLPFVNMSSDPEQEYFSDGLSEEILNLLAKVPDLKVIGRTSSFAFKGKNQDLREIGRALDTKTVLEGSVRKSGERVRITAQLIDVSSGAHLWSETYDRTITDIFAVQDNVAAEILGALQIHVGVAPTRGRPTENTEAYALFLKGRASIRVSEWQNAETVLLKAVELDPMFAEAYEMLAYGYWYRAGWFYEAAEGQKLTGDAAAKALAIDPDLVFAQALFAIGSVETFSFLAEIEAFERTVREQPGNTEALDALVWVLSQAGYIREALPLAERFVDLEPLVANAHTYLADLHHAIGRSSEAVAILEHADQLDMDYIKWGLGVRNLLEGQDDAAIAYFESFLRQQNFPDSSWVRELVTGGRDPATGQAYLDRRIPEIIAALPEESAFFMRLSLIQMYVVFGFIDRYFELILDLSPSSSTWTDAEIPIYNGTILWRLGFTAHPQYLKVVESMGIMDTWEQRGPPDFCSKQTGEWVCD